MIIVKLMGGLGNQMFQYALGRALSLQHGTTLKLDLQWLHDHRANRGPNFIHQHYDLDVFGIQPEIATEDEIRQLRKSWTPCKCVDRWLHTMLNIPPAWCREPHFHHSPAIRKSGADAYLDGYWQSEKYFASHAAAIRQDFTLRHPLEGHAASILERIENTTSVCVNVRRKEFVGHPYHGAMDPQYYAMAETRMRKLVKDPHFFIFSDEPEWCMEKLRFKGPVTHVPLTCAGEKYRDIFRMMTACRHFIIPNSTFGWWAAWLPAHPHKKVVAPYHWFANGPRDTQDLLPSGWERI